MAFYLAGPIANADDNDRDWWRDRATKLLGNVIDPRDWSGDHVVAKDKRAISDSEGVLAYCPWPSVGTSMEIMYAHCVGRPVVLVVPPGVVLSPWYLEHAAAITTELEQGVRALRGVSALLRQPD